MTESGIQARGQEFAQVIQERRSIRNVTNQPEVDRARIERVVNLALHAPSAFNMQSGRLVILTGEQHRKLWDIVRDTLRPLVPADSFVTTAQRLMGFRNGAGTILFFEDQETVRTMQQKAPLYAEQFPTWSQQGAGMLQYAAWLAFTAEGLGASLQHYNPLIDEAVRQHWNLSPEWKLMAQMPFGHPAETPAVPPHLPVEQVVIGY